MHISQKLSICKHYLCPSIVLMMTLFLVGCPSPTDPPIDNLKPILTITATPASVTEGEESTFTIRRNNVENKLMVNLTLSGSAEHIEDYTVDSDININPSTDLSSNDKSMTVTFERNDNSVNIIVFTKVDQNIEGNGETVIITIDTSSDYTLGTSDTAMLTIVEPLPTDPPIDNLKPILTIIATPASVTEGEESTFTIRRNNVENKLMVNLTLSGSAEHIEDYTVDSDININPSTDLSSNDKTMTVTFERNDDSVNIIVFTKVDQNIEENDETVIITIDTSSDYTLGTFDTAMLTIVEPSPTDRMEQHSFHVIDIKESTRYKINATLVASSDHAIVYLEDERMLPDFISAQDIADEFVTIRSVISDAFRSESDFDGNGKVIILLLDIRDNYHPQENLAYTAGYFNRNDLRNTGTSNRGEIIYMDINPGLVVTNGRTSDDIKSTFFSTITHEYMHLVHLGAFSLSETWLSEGLALAAEELYRNENLGRRITYYYIPGSFEQRNKGGFLSWSRQPIDYANVYLFFHWLRLQSDTSDSYLSPESSNVYIEIFNSEYSDYRAVTSVVNNIDMPGFSSLRDSDASTTWKKTLAHWFAATVAQVQTGLLGFEGFNENEKVGGKYSPVIPEICRPFSFPRKDILWDISTDLVNNVNEINLKRGNRLIVTNDYSTQIRMTDGDTRLALYGFDVAQKSHCFSDTINSDTISQTNLNIETDSFVEITTPDSTKDVLIAFNPLTDPPDSGILTGTFISTSSQSSRRSLSLRANPLLISNPIHGFDFETSSSPLPIDAVIEHDQ